jgi:hypothetical protein
MTSATIHTNARPHDPQRAPVKGIARHDAWCLEYLRMKRNGETAPAKRGLLSRVLGR